MFKPLGITALAAAFSLASPRWATTSSLPRDGRAGIAHPRPSEGDGES